MATLASELGVNICDIEIAHSIEGDRGVMSLSIEAASAESFRTALAKRGYRPAVRTLT